MRVLVTGAQGYLGKQVIKSLSEINGITVLSSGRYHEEGVYNYDLTNAVQVKNLIKQTFPDRIVHCAANVPQKLNEHANQNNADLTLNMLDLVLEMSACPIIYISSMTVYGDEYSRPVREKDAGNATSAYGRGKLLGETHIEQDGRSGIAIRIPGLFGLPRKSGLVYNVLANLKNHQQPSLPQQPILWAAMHVFDAAQSIAKLSLAQYDERFEAINVGYSGPTSIEHMIDIAHKAYDVENKYQLKQPSFEFDLSRAETFGVVPTRSLEDALVSFGNEI